MKRTADRVSKTPAGFTLIELMVSIGLVLILILGINQVFRIASDTINAGQALSSADRENRSIQAVLHGDIQNMVTTGAPCIIIRSQQQFAFRNLQDELGDNNYRGRTQSLQAQAPQIASIDLDADNNEGEGNVRGEIISPTAVNSRSHRLDELMFFANYLFQRQTGTGSRLSAEGSSKEAFIWYGHLQLANNQPTPAYFNPAELDTAGSVETGGAAGAGAKNDNNRFATQWALGRVPILLMGETIDTANPPTSSYIGRSGTNLSPLAENSVVQYPPGSGARPPGSAPQIQRFVSDVAQTSIADYRTLLGDPTKWVTGEGWWETVAGTRFWANPSPFRPLSADKISRTAPIFVQGCTQFIVEYAGDFLAQAPAPVLPADPPEGTITGYAPGGGSGGDGVTDFVMVRVPLNPPAATPFTIVRRTRWYGMPRNVDSSDDLTTGPLMIRGGSTGTNANQLIDVVPLRDVIATYTAGAGTVVKEIEPDIDRLLPMQGNYAGVNSVAPGARYVAAWGPSQLGRGSKVKPTMLRITIVVDDPAGRMSEGQRFEYVFNLPK